MILATASVNLPQTGLSPVRKPATRKGVQFEFSKQQARLARKYHYPDHTVQASIFARVYAITDSKQKNGAVRKC